MRKNRFLNVFCTALVAFAGISAQAAEPVSNKASEAKDQDNRVIIKSPLSRVLEFTSENGRLVTETLSLFGKDFCRRIPHKSPLEPLKGKVLKKENGEDGIAVLTRAKGSSVDVDCAQSPFAFALSLSDFSTREVVTNVIPLACEHLRVIDYQLMDQTDVHNELLQTREWLVMSRENDFSLETSAFAIEDPLTGDGLVFLREAPLPHARAIRRPDVRITGRGDSRRTLELYLWGGAPIHIAPYSFGAIGRTGAIQGLQKMKRPYRPKRDGLFLSNTWGEGNRDSRINEDFLRKEIDAAADIGVEVVQIDDGWQKGASANSVASKGKGVWNGYWAADPEFWTPHPTRFPNGFEPLIAYAKERNIRLGLWFGPDSSNDAANWEKDVACLVAFEKQGIPYFKIDSMKSQTPKALANQRRFFSELLARTEGRAVCDLDVTAEIRPGYFGVMEAGTIFVENRYPSWHGYWPHQTLRSLWSLAQVIPPVRLRMEMANPDNCPHLYQGDPLAPKAYRPDALFAMVMVASPLGWFENSALTKATRDALRPLVKRWKQERDNIYSGTTWPVGQKPDGVAWTGFLTLCDFSDVGYALLFRELNENAEYTLEWGPKGLPIEKVEVIGGYGTAKVENGAIKVNIPQKLDYIWVKFPTKM